MDRDTLEALVQRHQAELLRYVKYLGAEWAAAEDLVQETFLAAFQARRHPENADAPGAAAWLRVIARHMFLRHCRREKNRPLAVDDQHLEEAERVWAQEYLRGGNGDDYADALRQCLETVPPRQREALDMMYRLRCSRDDMAGRLGMTADGVKSLLRRIRAGLAACIAQRLADEGVA